MLSGRQEHGSPPIPLRTCMVYTVCADSVTYCIVHRATLELGPDGTTNELLLKYADYASHSRLWLEWTEAGEDKRQAWQLLERLALSTRDGSMESVLVRDPTSALQDLGRALGGGSAAPMVRTASWD
jgi:hypothetical protein